MTTRTMRQIVKIDEEKCNGCGLCVPACAEGALQIIDGKARLISEIYCDGLGACLGECPQDAIIIEEREAAEFDEEATKIHMEQPEPEPAVSEPLACGCPGAAVRQFERVEVPETATSVGATAQSRLNQWPVQLTLVPPSAPFLQGADILLAADCVPFAYAGFHGNLLKDQALLIACPKLDNAEAHLKKLTEILTQAKPKSITVLRMEVPCCFGLVHIAKQAIAASGLDIPLEEVIVGVRGDMKS